MSLTTAKTDFTTLYSLCIRAPGRGAGFAQYERARVLLGGRMAAPIRWTKKLDAQLGTDSDARTKLVFRRLMESRGWHFRQDCSRWPARGFVQHDSPKDGAA